MKMVLDPEHNSIPNNTYVCQRKEQLIAPCSIQYMLSEVSTGSYYWLVVGLGEGLSKPKQFISNN